MDIETWKGVAGQIKGEEGAKQRAPRGREELLQAHLRAVLVQLALDSRGPPRCRHFSKYSVRFSQLWTDLQSESAGQEG